MEEMQARIDERDLHGAIQAYLWSMAMVPMFLWEEAGLEVGDLVNDGQMRHVVDLGLAGPDKGKGGRYLILGPGVEEPENHDADYVA